MKAHTHLSSYRESLLEHLFVGALLREFWIWGEEPLVVEVMKPQVDDAGYDVVLEVGGITRHVQLKSSYLGSKTARQKIHLKLGNKRSGCVIWIYFNPKTMEMGPFLWFGGKPGKPLPPLDSYKVARHTKGDASGYKAERPMLRVVPKGSFDTVTSIRELALRLFGKSVMMGSS